jgi:aldose sugar dehydrogenase
LRSLPARVLGALLLAAAVGCAAPAPSPTPRTKPAAKPAASKPGAKPTAPPTEVPTPQPTRVTRAFPAEPKTYLEGVLIPSSLTFAPDGRLFFVEVTQGTIRIATNGVLQPEPFYTFDIAKVEEHGLLGLALDPEFSRNRFVYAYYTNANKSGKPFKNLVVRLTDHGGVGVDETKLRDDIPVDVRWSHNGGRLRFGPDGKLYVTTGASGDGRNDAQQLGVLEGKLLRLNPDGSIPADNPFPGSPVFALGFRNPWGMAFHPQTGKLYVTDNGPKGFDELDLVERGSNHGSPDVVGVPGDPRFSDPLWHSGEDRLGVVGLTFYDGLQFPEYRGDAFFCLWNPGILRRVRLAPPGFDRVVESEDLAVDCRTDVATGPDGALYVASFNRVQRLSR